MGSAVCIPRRCPLASQIRSGHYELRGRAKLRANFAAQNSGFDAGIVHPYLRRREGKEKVEYPTPALEAVLGKTLGVPLFQESAMKVAMTCLGFTAGEADQLRRAMATFKFTGGVSKFKYKLVEDMVKNGYTREFAEKTFTQLEGFGSCGFPESQAASFALFPIA